jgi:hypothetical protein
MVVPLADRPFRLSIASDVAFDFAGTGGRAGLADAGCGGWCGIEWRGQVRSGFDMIGRHGACSGRWLRSAARAWSNRDGELTGGELGGLSLGATKTAAA